MTGRWRDGVTGRLGDDSGVTLMELVVGLAIMSIFMAIFTTGIVTIFRAVNRTEASSVSQSQINIAFLRLDKEIRYARAISQPDIVGGDPYAEYLCLGYVRSGAPYCGLARPTDIVQTVCTELRVDAGRLQHRTWVQGDTPIAPTAWQSLISDVADGTPFTLVPATPTFGFQRLELQLSVSYGAGDRAVSRSTDLTFTALNTSGSTSSDDVCTEGRLVS